MLNKIASWYETTKRLKFFGLLLFAIIITFQPVFFAPTYIIGFFWLFYLLSFKPPRLNRLLASKWFWLFTIFYLYYVFGITYTENVAEGWRLVLLKITFFLWPLAFGSLSRLSKKHVQIILYVFVLALFASTFILLSRSSIEFIEYRNVKVFFGSNLAKWRFLPNHYLSLYVSFALLILAKDFTNGSIKEDLFKGPKIFLFAYFLLISILLAVRIQLIALPFAMLILIVLQHKKRVAGKLNLKPIILGIVGFSIIVLVLPDTRRRIVESYHEIRSFNKVIDNKQTNHRVYIWKSAVKVIGENFWFGTGSGDADDELAKHLDVIDAKFWNGKEVYYLKSGTYNYHNQYLQWWASNGVIGIAALLIILFGGVTQSYKRGDFLTVVMLVLVALSFMTESMLERQAGVLFFTFFFGLLVINQAQSKSQV